MIIRYARIKRKDRESMVWHVLEQVGLYELAERFPHVLSGGECQRVAIARTFVNNPDILLADEPTGALDEETENTIMDILAALNREGKTIVIVTHDPLIAQRCKRIVYLRNGEISDQARIRL